MSELKFLIQTRLAENLVTAEKHGLLQCKAMNLALSVCDLLAHLGTDQLHLQAENRYRLVHKAIEFYLSYDQAKKEELKQIKIKDVLGKALENSKLSQDLSITLLHNFHVPESFGHEI